MCLYTKICFILYFFIKNRIKICVYTQKFIMQIYNELLYRGYNVDIGVIESFLKDNDKTIKKMFEIDFIANKGNENLYSICK